MFYIIFQVLFSNLSRQAEALLNMQRSGKICKKKEATGSIA
jgi:hypothetical protein